MPLPPGTLGTLAQGVAQPSLWQTLLERLGGVGGLLGAPAVPGQVAAGTLDWKTIPKGQSGAKPRPMIHQDDQGRFVLLPTLPGQADAAAVQAYRQSGKHLGQFRDWQSASAYAKTLGD